MNDSVEKFMTTPRNLAGKITHKIIYFFTNVFTICMYSYLELEISAPGACDNHARSFIYSYPELEISSHGVYEIRNYSFRC
jgi:hypothetical protein